MRWRIQHKKMMWLMPVFVAAAGIALASPDSTKLAANTGAPENAVVVRSFMHVPATNTPTDPIYAEVVTDDSVSYHRAQAQALQEKITSRDAFVNSFSEALQVELPVGIASGNNDPSYAIIISQIRTTSAAAYIDAYVLLQIPTTGEKIAFRGTNIEFSHDGGFTGTGRLALVGDYFLRINDKTLAWLIGKGNTFVEFDCNGFKGMGIEAEVQFSRDLIIPEGDNGKLLAGNERVKTKFLTYVQSWGDILVGVSIPPFQFADLPGFGFRVTEAFLDWSDRANPPSLAFPPGYVTAFQSPDLPAVGAAGPGAVAQNPLNLWHGFYLQRLEVRFPASFKASKDSTRRVTVGAERMLLDEQGLSGVLFAENVLDSGSMSGWNFTLDRAALEVVANQVKGFQLSGKLSVPMLKTKAGKPTWFGYLAQRGADGGYLFATRVESDLRMPLLLAELTVAQGSTITIAEKNDRFLPTLVLNGHLGIKGTQNGPRPELLGIAFQGLRISTEAPHFDIQAIGFGREGQQQKVSSFPITINNLNIRREENRLGLGFDVSVQFGAPEDDGFGGTAGLIVWGTRGGSGPVTEGQLSQNGSRWRFDRVELTAVGIRANKPGTFSIDGLVRFFDQDPDYGEGFSGRINGSVGPMGDGAKFQVFALFGKTSSFRYWYVDALGEFTPGLPIVPGVLEARGFGGGYYHRMKQSAQPLASGIGRAPSGITYVPDQNTRGVRAMMTITTPTPAVFNGLVTLEIPMNRHGGINSVTMTGNFELLNFRQIAQDQIKELAKDAAAGRVAGKLASLLGGQIYGSFVLHFDNVNDVFHGTMETFVNVAGGLTRGVGAGNRAGWAVIHFERSTWQVLIGTPNQPLGIEVARMFRSRSYFMAGKNLPGSPPPPEQARSLLGGNDLDYMRDFNALESGTGFAFGLHFTVDTGDINFLMFYGRFGAGVGADLMLKNYGSGYSCAGSSGPFGINGWYANGQAYAFVHARIGIRVNLRFYKGKYDILRMGVAALMQAKAPNPFWMRGIVSGQYNILGGLVRGNCRFEITVGEECRPVGEQELLADVAMIAAVSPADGASEVDVFTTPQVAFNVPVGQVFEITDLENRKRFFRAVLNEFSVRGEDAVIPGQLTWNANRDVVVLDAKELLPGEKTLKAIVRLTFEERVNGTWQKSTFQGNVAEETVNVTFRTSKAPDFIPPNNVAVSYPLQEMVNFYPREYTQGFIELKRGQAYLFDPGPEWVQKIRMTTGERFLETDLTYRAAARRVEFTIPNGFENAKVYRFEILNIPRVSQVIDANVQRIERELTPTDGTATLTTKKLEGTAEKLEVKSIYSSSLRTSRYNTFVEKMRSIDLATPSFRVPVYNNVFQLVSRMRGPELFDVFEMPQYNTNRSALVDLEAILEGNAWFNNHVKPLVYDGYPLMGSLRITRRDISILGLYPVRDIFLAEFDGIPSAPADQPRFTGRELITYNLNQSVYLDHRDLIRQAANLVVTNPNSVTQRLSNLLLRPEPKLRYGEYIVRLNYFIPGQSLPSSFFDWRMFNRVPDNERD